MISRPIYTKPADKDLPAALAGLAGWKEYGPCHGDYLVQDKIVRDFDPVNDRNHTWLIVQHCKNLGIMFSIDVNLAEALPICHAAHHALWDYYNKEKYE